MIDPLASRTTHPQPLMQAEPLSVKYEALLALVTTVCLVVGIVFALQGFNPTLYAPLLAAGALTLPSFALFIGNSLKMEQVVPTDTPTAMAHASVLPVDDATALTHSVALPVSASSVAAPPVALPSLAPASSSPSKKSPEYKIPTAEELAEGIRRLKNMETKYEKIDSPSSGGKIKPELAAGVLGEELLEDIAYFERMPHIRSAVLNDPKISTPSRTLLDNLEGFKVNLRIFRFEHYQLNIEKLVSRRTIVGGFQLGIIQVKSLGNCLYDSVLLGLLAIGVKVEDKMSPKKLREQAVQRMRDQFEYFKSFIEAAAGEEETVIRERLIKEKEGIKSWDTKSAKAAERQAQALANVEKELAALTCMTSEQYLEAAAHEGWYGRGVEILALAQIYRVKIRIDTPEGEITYDHGPMEIQLKFTGNHYDFVQYKVPLSLLDSSSASSSSPPVPAIAAESAYHL